MPSLARFDLFCRLAAPPRTSGGVGGGRLFVSFQPERELIVARLLYLETSPRKERSHSIAVAQAFLAAYQGLHPEDEIETWDLWNTRLPEFDGLAINAKYRILHGQSHSAEEAAAWQVVVDVFRRFANADKYLLSLPMWNFGIPYKLKHFIDVIAQPGLTFHFSPETGYQGLVTGRPITVVYARGGAYGSAEAAAIDFQKPYLEHFLRFIGFTDIRPIVVEPMLGAPDAVNTAKAAAIEAAQREAERM